MKVTRSILLNYNTITELFAKNQSQIYSLTLGCESKLVMAIDLNKFVSKLTGVVHSPSTQQGWIHPIGSITSH